MDLIATSPDLALYRVAPFSSSSGSSFGRSSNDTSHASVTNFVASTPGTRAIANDPFVCGARYTISLEHACAKVLRALADHDLFRGEESCGVVLHVLRGGLNFGLRTALTTALGWNNHASAFVSAQRAHGEHDSHEWFITEHSYKKIFLGPVNDLVLGDVVATGTSLEYALTELLGAAHVANAQIRSITFFTIGGARSAEILARAIAQYSSSGHPAPRATVVYFEGIFGVPNSETPLRVKLEDTDLIRRDAILAPDFIESQYEAPRYPLERCAIYDAGSRAFYLPEYWHDVREYWNTVAHLANEGVTFGDLLAERSPILDPERFGSVNLAQLADAHLKRMPAARHSTSVPS